MNIMGHPPVRAIALATGVVAGAALTVPLERALPSSEQVAQASSDGRELESYDDTLATIGSTTFIAAAGTAAGIARRGAGPQSTPLMLLSAAGMFTGLAASTLAKSEREGRSHLVSLGLLSAVAGVGYLAGASPRVPLSLAQNGALASLGLFAGAAGIETVRWIGDETSLLRESVDWKSAQKGSS